MASVALNQLLFEANTKMYFLIGEYQSRRIAPNNLEKQIESALQAFEGSLKAFGDLGVDTQLLSVAREDNLKYLLSELDKYKQDVVLSSLFRKYSPKDNQP